MYNGQFVKALVHVLVFVVVISIAEAHNAFGMFVMAWVFYQMFDAYQTAKARRFGLPLPDPFGLNELGYRISSPYPGRPVQYPAGHAVDPGSTTATAAAATSSFVPGSGQETAGSSSAGFAQGANWTSEEGWAPAPGSAATGIPAPSSQYAYTPVSTSVPPPSPSPGPESGAPPFAPTPPAKRRSEPVGAIILIVLGLLFLFSTTGFLDGEWVTRGWPLILIGIGAWLIIKRIGEWRNSGS